MNIIEIPTLSSDMTLEQWLTYWFDAYIIRNVKRSTAVAYLGYINNHIAPKIGKYKLSELNTNVLQVFFNSESDNGSARGGGLSPKSLQNIKRMLHKALEKAVETELISKNYSNYVDIPAVIPPEMIVLTVNEHKRRPVYLRGCHISLHHCLRCLRVKLTRTRELMRMKFFAFQIWKASVMLPNSSATLTRLFPVFLGYFISNLYNTHKIRIEYSMQFCFVSVDKYA